MSVSTRSAGPFSAYTDYVSPRFLALAVLAGVDHARRTGRGQHIDVSQVEATVQLLAPALLDHAVNGRAISRAGNDDRRFAPHGVYTASDPACDEWIAIACTDDAQWTRLSQLIGSVDLADLSVDDIARAIDINVRSTLVLTRLLLPGMLVRGSGHVVIIGSLAGLAATPRSSVYNASKFALRGFGHALRE